jgi:hypothetical protein
LRPFAVGGAGGLLIGPEDVEEAHAARKPIPDRHPAALVFGIRPTQSSFLFAAFV